MVGVCTTDPVASELLTFNFKSYNSERNFAFSTLSSDTSDDKLLKLLDRSDNDASTDLFEDKDSLRNSVIADIKLGMPDFKIKNTGQNYNQLNYGWGGGLKRWTLGTYHPSMLQPDKFYTVYFMKKHIFLKTRILFVNFH